MRITKIFNIALILVFFSSLAGLNAAEISAKDAELVKKSNNPMGNLISFPLQFNYDYGSGPDKDGSKVLLNVQPIVPIHLNDDLMVLSRTILPVQYLDNGATFGEGSTFGLGDTVQSFFIGPKNDDSKLIWGVGPAFMLPTATEDYLSIGKDKWSVGPGAIIGYQDKGWTFAAITYQVWSFAGAGWSDDVDFLFFQPVILKSLGLVTVGVNSEIQKNWRDGSTIVPLNFMVTKLMHFGKMPVNVGAGLRYYIERPNEFYSKWGARFVMTFMFPD